MVSEALCQAMREILTEDNAGPRKLIKAGVVTFDVETTFQKDLCLAQLGTTKGNWLIDALAIDDLSPLLESPRAVKVIQ